MIMTEGDVTLNKQNVYCCLSYNEELLQLKKLILHNAV